MSKKKAFSGSTMTLKDFHGGSIPSDLPLPSAPGVTVRPSDRPGFDRHIPTAWGNPIGRSDHRSRPGSSGATRNFDEKASFLSHPAHIGRNFDEDERKPLDCLSVPRRTVSDESLRPPSRPEQKPDSLSSVKFSGSGKQVSSPVSYTASTAASSFPSRFTGASPVGGNPQPSNASNGSTVSSSSPNAWGMRKEVVGVSEPVPSSAWSGPSAVSKFAQATALEKVSSGRWQSKHPVHHQPDVEVIRLPETEGDFCPKDGYAYNVVDPASERGDHNVTQGRYTEKGWTAADGIRSGGKEAVDYERARSPIYPEAKERNLSFYSDGVRPASTEGRFVGSQLPPPVPSEVSERPKLKLLPRSKPLENSEPHLVDYKQGHHQSTNSGHLETLDEPCANANSSKPGLTGAEGSNRPAERPKLNLKPRSQPLEQSEGNVERERQMLFGGARPRELVLKERGIDDVSINNLDINQQSNRIKHEFPKTETKSEPVGPLARYGERADNFGSDQRITRDSERVEMHMSSWRNENKRNGRETDKQQQERRPEPETWRKPAEQAKASPDAPGLRYGKAATALELAQAFSRSISDPKAADRFSGQRGLPGRNQVPFSRLTDTREFYSGPTPRRQINGY